VHLNPIAFSYEQPEAAGTGYRAGGRAAGREPGAAPSLNEALHLLERLMRGVSAGG
jgi:hypothetical protein